MRRFLNISRGDWVGGTTTFFTMAYIVVVNPSILSTPGTGLSFSAVMTATVVLSASMTLLMGLYAKIPFAVAPGMGVNAFFTYSLILGQKIPAPVALAMVFWAGVLFLLVSLTPLRVKMAEAIPESLRLGLSAGIGLFLTFIGLQNGGWVMGSPVTLVQAAPLSVKSFLTLAGVLTIGLMLRKKSAFSFLAVILGIAATDLWLQGGKLPEKFITPPDFSLLGALDYGGALKLAALPAMLSILFTDLFDSIATFVGVSAATGLCDEKGRPQALKQGLVVDAFATMSAGFLGTSSGTAFIESAAGIEAGGRSGRASVVTALWFLPCLFLAPWAALVPAYATAPVLIFVGLLMFRGFSGLVGKPWEEAIPAFLTLVLIPLTFSITQGILWGFLSHSFLFVVTGRRREIPPTLWVITGIAALLLGIEFYEK